MPIQTITKYITSDGREFVDADTAKLHETFLEVRGEIQSGLQAHHADKDAVTFSMVARTLIEKPDFFGKILLRIRRKKYNKKYRGKVDSIGAKVIAS